jgi:hypothetical protein
MKRLPEPLHERVEVLAAKVTPLSGRVRDLRTQSQMKRLPKPLACSVADR